ncbi:MAG: DUF362 domain-containing protein [Dehalococcoidales bacterium]
MGKSAVSIVKGPKNPSDKDIEAVVSKAIELAGGLTDIISSGDTVIINPNVVIPQPPEIGTTTDPRVCKAIADLVKEIDARPIIGEASVVGVDTEEAFQAAGYTKLREEGYEVIDLKKEETVEVPIPKGKSLKKVSLPKLVIKAKAIISVPKMKTHDQATVTLSLKNTKGLMPDTFKRKFHTTFGIYQGVADLCTVVRPAFAVVDGIIAQEGLGPMFGLPVEMDLIIAGKDPVAVDAVTSVIMGFEPRESGCVDAAHKMKIGTADLNEIEVVGESIAKVQRRFKRAEEAVFEMIKLPEGFQLLLDDKACSGCRICVLSSLVDLKEQGKLDKAAGLTIVAGKITEFPNVDREHLLLVGNCVAKFKQYAAFVPGCTPNNRDVVAGVLGEESKVMYTARGKDVGSPRDADEQQEG